MKITCPHCARIAHIDESAIPEGAKSVTCHSCGTSFPLLRDTSSRSDSRTGDLFCCPICHTEQKRGNMCEKCGLVFEKYLHRKTKPSTGDQTVAATSAPVQPEVPRGVSTGHINSLSLQTSIRKYLLLFAASYIGLMIVAGLALAALHIKRNSGINSGVFLCAVMWALGAFAKDYGRLWDMQEKRRLIIGIMLISISFDLVVSLAAFPKNADIGIIIFIFGFAVAFVGFLRLLVLMYFMGSKAERLFGKTISSAMDR